MGNGLDTQFTRPFPFLQKWVFWFARLVPYHVWTRVVQSMLGLMTKDLWWMHPNAALILTNQKTRVQKYQMQRLTHECAVVDWVYRITIIQYMYNTCIVWCWEHFYTHASLTQMYLNSFTDLGVNLLPTPLCHSENITREMLWNTFLATRERERNWVRLCPTCVSLSHCKSLLSLHVGRCTCTFH